MVRDRRPGGRPWELRTASACAGAPDWPRRDHGRDAPGCVSSARSPTCRPVPGGREKGLNWSCSGTRRCRTGKIDPTVSIHAGTAVPATNNPDRKLRIRADPIEGRLGRTAVGARAPTARPSAARQPTRQRTRVASVATARPPLDYWTSRIRHPGCRPSRRRSGGDDHGRTDPAEVGSAHNGNGVLREALGDLGLPRERHAVLPTGENAAKRTPMTAAAVGVTNCMTPARPSSHRPYRVARQDVPIRTSQHTSGSTNVKISTTRERHTSRTA